MYKNANLKSGTVRYREIGEGPTLVFVHGLLVNGGLWDSLVKQLSTQFHCVVPDLPLGAHRPAMNADADLSPHGIAALIKEFCDVLELDDVTLVGNDTGGAMCQIAVGEYPQRFSRLVLTTCDGYEVFPPKMFAIFGLLAKVPFLFRAVLQPMRFRALRAMPFALGWLHKKPFTSQVEQGFVRPALEEPGVVRDVCKFLRGVSPQVTLAAAQKMGTFKNPVLVIWSGDDKFFPEELGRRIAGTFDDARFEVVVGARTFVCHDEPEAVAALVTDFVGTRRDPLRAVGT